MRIRQLFLSIVIVAFYFSTVNAQVNMPENIRVGLKYNSTAPASVCISSINGLKLGFKFDNSYLCLYTQSSNEDVFVRKDGYFSNQNGLYIEVPPEQTPDNNNMCCGPYHIQISEVFSEKKQM